MRAFSDMNWMSRRWGGFRWTRWIPVDELTSVNDRRGTVPEREGVYRIRMRCPRRLAYIGQSGDLADRIIGTWNHANKVDSCSASGEQALHHLWEWLKWLGGGTYEISWTLSSPDWTNGLHDKKEREACERYFMWLYRQETGRSAFANHGRASGTGNRLIGIKRTGRCPRERDSDRPCGKSPRRKPNPMRPSSRPCYDRARPPHSTSWMGTEWTHMTGHRQITQGGPFDLRNPWFGNCKRLPGVYKILDSKLQEVLSVGYGGNLRTTLTPKLKELPGRPVGAWHKVPYETFQFQRQELVDDLVGACYARYGRAIRHGFPDS